MQRERQAQIGEFWLSKRKGSNRWYITWFDAGLRQTRRVTTGTEDIRHAEMKLAEHVIRNQTLRDERPDDVPLETLFVRYYENHAAKQPSAEAARFHLRYWSEFWNGRTVSELADIDLVQRFVSELENRGFSAGYIQRIMTTGKAAVRHAYKRNEIASVPYFEIVRSSTQRDYVMSGQEIGALIDYAAEHLVLFLLIALNTAARPAAILELSRKQVDFERRLLTLNPAGRRQTKKFRPTIPITDTLLPWLRKSGPGPVVLFKGRQIKSIKKSFAKARDRAGLSKEIVPYTIRHTVATELRLRAVDEWECAGFLGHSIPGETERYAKYRPNFMSKTVKAIDEWMDEIQSQTERRIVPLSLASVRDNCVS